jgi:hypothetical protein
MSGCNKILGRRNSDGPKINEGFGATIVIIIAIKLYYL